MNIKKERIDEIKQFVLSKIKPTEREIKEKNKIVQEFLAILKEKFDDIILGGSFAKNTWLKGDHDVDIFIRFERNMIKDSSDLVEQFLKEKNLDYERIPASRDYFRVKYRGLEFEIVPILKINKPEEAENTTDLSPFHVNWFLEELRKNPNLADEIRITKMFMKSCKVYGAESYIQGFSGYAVEILLAYYRDFYNLIKDVLTNWKPKLIIDLKGYYKSKKEIFKVLGKDKTRSPIIVIDPTYPKRNASAALSMESFSKFIYCVLNFALDLDRDPNYLYEQYFKVKKLTVRDLLQKYSGIEGKRIIIELKSNIKNKDIRNAKIKSLEKYIRKHLTKEGFYIIVRHIEFQEKEEENAFIFYLIHPEKLSKYKIHKGPVIWLHNAALEFINKWKRKIINIDESGRLYTIVEREYMDPVKFISDLVKLKDIKKELSYFKVYEI